MPNLKLTDLPFIPATISLPSKHLKVAGIGGPQPVRYLFTKGKSTQVDDPEDVEMLLSIKRQVPGPGGIGNMKIDLLEIASDDARVKTLSTEEKLEKILSLLEQRGISLGAVMDGDEAPTAPDPDLDDSL